MNSENINPAKSKYPFGSDPTFVERCNYFREAGHDTTFANRIASYDWNDTDPKNNDYRCILKPKIAERWAVALETYPGILGSCYLKARAKAAIRVNHLSQRIEGLDPEEPCHCAVGLLGQLAVDDGIAKWEARDMVIPSMSLLPIDVDGDVLRSKPEDYSDAHARTPMELDKWAVEEVAHDAFLESCWELGLRPEQQFDSMITARLGMVSHMNDSFMNAAYELEPKFEVRKEYSDQLCQQLAKLVREELVYTGKPVS